MSLYLKTNNGFDFDIYLNPNYVNAYFGKV